MNKTYISKIVKATSKGVSFELSEAACLNGRGIHSKKWYVSWDKIGEALFSEQYDSEPERVTKEQQAND